MIVLYLNLILSLFLYVDKAPFKIKRLRSKNKKLRASLFLSSTEYLVFVRKIKSQQYVLVSLVFCVKPIHKKLYSIIIFCLPPFESLPWKLIDFSAEIVSKFFEFSLMIHVLVNDSSVMMTSCIRSKPTPYKFNLCAFL